MWFLAKDKKLKILFVTSEEAPFAKVGGLGEVMFSLPRALKELGHDARVMIPCYGLIDHKKFRLPYVYRDLDVPTSQEGGGKYLRCNVRKFTPTREGRAPVTTYFLENQEYYELRSNVYGYGDDSIRYALLSRGALEFLNRHDEWIPDVIVTTDWMTGYLPNFLKAGGRKYARLKSTATLFSIHNLSSQGTVRFHKFLTESERDDGHGPIPDFSSPRMKNINAMKRGILNSDLINTVSPTYAREITTDEFGEGLDGLLRERRDRLFGILNGIDYDTTNPAVDSALAKTFTPTTVDLRVANKRALQRRFGLPETSEVFMVGIISRLVRQKGFSLLPGVIEPFLRVTGAQLIVAGTGDTEIMEFFQKLESDFPQQVRAVLQFDEKLPRLMYAGVDAVLIPSRFEPCGLTQMEAMRFGAVPVARKIGGLADSIEDYSPETGLGTGFLFDEFEAPSLLIALTRACTIWRYKPSWLRMQRQVMERDFSWTRSAGEYVALFRRAMEMKQGGT